MVDPNSDHLRAGVFTGVSTFVFPTGPRTCPAHANEARPTGRHQRRLGPAHVRDSGRRTPRGAIVWRAANGSKPDPTYLTPAEAEAALDELLAAAVREPTD